MARLRAVPADGVRSDLDAELAEAAARLELVVGLIEARVNARNREREGEADGRTD